MDGLYYISHLFADKIQKTQSLQNKNFADFEPTLIALLVEVTGIEPVSKHDVQKLSTCLFQNYLSGNNRNRTNQLFP